MLPVRTEAMKIAVHLLLLLVVLLLITGSATMTTTTTTSQADKPNAARGFFEETLEQLVRHRRTFLEGFGNGTAAIEKQLARFDEEVTLGAAEAEAEGEGRGSKKKMRQMNRTMMAIIMAYTLKFMFLMPTFVGTLILLKFTTALAGFFYALFAAVLGLEHHNHH